MATALEEIEERMAALEGATPEQLKKRQAELDAQLRGYKDYAKASKGYEADLEGARRGREQGFGFEDPTRPTPPSSSMEARYRAEQQAAGSAGSAAVPLSPAEQAQNLKARQDLAARMSQRMSSEDFQKQLGGFETEAKQLGIDRNKFRDFWVKGAANRYQSPTPTADAGYGGPQITDPYGPPTEAQLNLAGRQGLAARMSERMDPETFMKKLEGFKAEADKLGVTPEQFQGFSDRVNPRNVMSEQMARSKDLEGQGYKGFAGMEKDKAARTAGLPLGYDRGAKPIADFTTRMERMAKSAERRGQRGTAAALSSAAGQFKTEEEFMNEINRDKNPVVAAEMGDIRNYRDFLVSQAKDKAKAEAEELAGRGEKDGAEAEDGGRVSRANETREERRARLQKKRDDKKNYRGEYGLGYSPDDEESD